MTLKELHLAVRKLAGRGCTVSVEIDFNETVLWRIWSSEYGSVGGRTAAQALERFGAVVSTASAEKQSIEEASDAVGDLP